jgi:hypothetical protein
MIATDGSALHQILERLGGARIDPDGVALVDELERQLGRRLPEETREFFRHRPPLIDPGATGHPEIGELDFFGGLPDVNAWLTRLATGLEGPLLACCQFFGLIPFAVRLDAGDFLFALTPIESFDGGRLGGVFTYDEREVSLRAPTISRFLADELERFRDRGGEYDCYALGVDPGLAVDFAEVPDAVTAAYETGGADSPECRGLWWICAALRGEIAAWAVDAIPTPELWDDQRERVASSHGHAMFWLLAHAILGNRAELADAAALSRANPSLLVAALRDWLERHPAFVDRHRDWREGLYALARRSG